MRPRDDLASAIATAGRELLRPASPTAATPEPRGSLRLENAVHLGAGRWVCVVADEGGARWTVPALLSGGVVHRAVAGDLVADALVDCIAGGRSVEPPFAVQAFAGYPVAGERSVGVDQTNESVVVGEAAVVKWCLHLPGRGNATPDPAARRLAVLAAAGFAGMPPLWGLLSLDPGDDAPLLLASVTGYLPGAVDGWDWATADARAFAAGDVDLADAVAPAAILGDLTARMHVAFAQSGRDDAAESDAARWAAAAGADLASAVVRIDGPEGDRLAARAPVVAAELAAIGDAAGTPLIDVHGDLHVGQALRYGSPASYAITDFDGSPVVPVDERGRRQPAAVDVAGMLASLDHVGRVVLRRTPDVNRARVLSWIEGAQGAFLEAYRTGLDEAGASELLDERLLRPLLFWQECREFLYAAQHLPHWRYVPDEALAALMAGRG